MSPHPVDSPLRTNPNATNPDFKITGKDSFGEPIDLNIFVKAHQKHDNKSYITIEGHKTDEFIAEFLNTSIKAGLYSALPDIVVKNKERKYIGEIFRYSVDRPWHEVRPVIEEIATDFTKEINDHPPMRAQMQLMHTRERIGAKKHIHMTPADLETLVDMAINTPATRNAMEKLSGEAQRTWLEQQAGRALEAQIEALPETIHEAIIRKIQQSPVKNSKGALLSKKGVITAIKEVVDSVLKTVLVDNQLYHEGDPALTAISDPLVTAISGELNKKLLSSRHAL